MSAPDNCPLCDTDLRGEPIPEKSRHNYGGKTHFKREILIQIQGVYDGGLFYMCPDCGGYFHRFPEGHYLRERAEQHMPTDNIISELAKEQEQQ